MSLAPQQSAAIDALFAGDVEGNAIINAPRVVVRKMPWKQPPARTGQEAKYGPWRVEVGTLYGTVSPSRHDARSRWTFTRMLD